MDTNSIEIVPFSHPSNTYALDQTPTPISIFSGQSSSRDTAFIIKLERTVANNPPLTITAPPNVTVNTDLNVCSATQVNLGTATTSGGRLPIIVTNNAPSIFPLGVTTLTWTATDSSVPLSTVTATQTIAVVDKQAPAITAPPNKTVIANTASGVTAVNLGTPKASDNCPGVKFTNNAPSTFPLGVTTVKWKATDASGNTKTASQTVTVLTPAQGIQNIINKINNLNLPDGVQTSLTAPLNNAIKILTDDNPNNDKAVCGKLDAFINEVNAKEKNGSLTATQATKLRQLANAIKVSLGC